MHSAGPNRELELSQALKQLATDHRQGRLSMSGYRRLRRKVLEAAAGDTELLPLAALRAPAVSRPGVIVWAAIVVILVALAAVVWLVL